MPDSVQMIDELVAHLETLPKTAGGDIKVESATELAVNFVGIVAPLYNPEIDEGQQRAASAEALASSLQDELIGLRAEVDKYRSVVSAAIGAIDNGDYASAQTVLGTL